MSDVTTLKTEIVSSEKTFGKKTLHHYKQQGQRANDLYALITDSWEDTCKEMGFTVQSVNGWRRLRNGWETIKDRVESGEIYTLRQALDALKKPKDGDNKSKNKKPKDMHHVAGVLLDKYHLERNELVELLTDVAYVVKAKSLLALIEQVKTVRAAKAA